MFIQIQQRTVINKNPTHVIEIYIIYDIYNDSISNIYAYIYTNNIMGSSKTNINIITPTYDFILSTITSLSIFNHLIKPQQC